MITRRSTPRFALGVVIAAFIACGTETDQGDAGTSGDKSSDGAQVTIETFAFAPKAIEAELETTVMWTNQDDILHTVTSGRPPRQGVPGVSEDKDARPDGRFDHELDGAGSTAQFTFEERGTYTYFCSIHKGMSGEVTIR